MPLDQGEATRLLNASFGEAAYTAPTAPMRLALMTNIGTATTAGAEVANAGGSAYARQDLSAALPVATAPPLTSNAAISFTNMPDTSANNIESVEVYDSAATPRRAWYGALTTARTTALGDTLTIASGSFSATFT